jgi:PTS system N-acetylglucosamine-specific IIC component
MTSLPATPSGGRKIFGLAVAQRIGRSLMLPIAVLPAAALLLRLGQADLVGADGLGWTRVAEPLAAAGAALFDNLPLLFAVGVAVGFAKKSDGSTALAAVVGYLVFDRVSRTLFADTASLSDQVNSKIDGVTALNLALPNPTGVLGGIVIGITAALLWQRYYRIKLPTYLAFFGGRRFVPIVTAVAALLLGVLFRLIWPTVGGWLEDFGGWLTGAGALGAGIYGTANRLLIPLGLHHILNSLVWFVFGSYKDPQTGVVAHGDLSRFFAHDPSAGQFMTGFFPIMMFALPAAAFAIWQEAKPTQKKIVGGIMLSAALTSFVTGVTEPLEFSFLFVAWPLYFIHALLTGSSLALTNALGIHDGFGFSAGAIDYTLNFDIATRPLLLIPIGLGYAVIYYFIFRWVIRKWNLKTPGREEDEAEPEVEASATTP